MHKDRLACSVALAARGLAASRLLCLIDNKVAGMRDFRSLDPARMRGESMGMQTLASISLLRVDLHQIIQCL